MHTLLSLQPFFLVKKSHAVPVGPNVDGFQPGSDGERLSASHQHLKPCMRRNMMLMLMLMVTSSSSWDLFPVLFRYLITHLYLVLSLLVCKSMFLFFAPPKNTLCPGPGPYFFK